MKNIAILFTILISCLYYSQENSFSINNKQVVWQKIYDSTKNIDEVKNILTSSGKVNVTSIESGILNGDVSDYMMDYKGAGNTRAGTPIFIYSSKFFTNFKIEFKENKYRVTITNIRLKGNSGSLYSSGVAISNDGNENLESYALTNDKESFRNNFEGRASKIINYSFTQLFDVSKYTETNDNW
ncbi:hypothetical protein [Chryseobacterium sp. MYb328]|uniref:hypothetical protein n=1 Tax=Chryseobacterium sp. MYb328 TaxID=2745231 RepID=UPI003097A9A0